VFTPSLRIRIGTRKAVHVIEPSRIFKVPFARLRIRHVNFFWSSISASVIGTLRLSAIRGLGPPFRVLLFRMSSAWEPSLFFFLKRRCLVYFFESSFRLFVRALSVLRYQGRRRETAHGSLLLKSDWSQDIYGHIGGCTRANSLFSSKVVSTCRVLLDGRGRELISNQWGSMVKGEGGLIHRQILDKFPLGNPSNSLWPTLLLAFGKPKGAV